MSRRYAVAGRVVAVTGGGRGIGERIAVRLAAAGARVAVGDIDETAAVRVASELGDEHVGRHLDVTSTESFGAFLDEVGSTLGSVDVLVNNAGVMWVGPFAEEPEICLRRQLEVNLVGVMRGVRLVAPAMQARGSGHIVTIASAGSLLALPGEASYAATKHGVLGYLKAVREELLGSGVHLSVVLPAVVDTQLAAGTATGIAGRLSPDRVAEAVLEVLTKPRFEVSIPRYVDPLNRAIGLLPRPARDAVSRRLVPNQLRESDPGARADYQSRLETD
ncbi:SDR family NAD(P)-dependent oxidoreductase [Nostocoides sp. F2B08]|uniref:SDR family NAD(P)-dependent oxidoreductase n=1 Tax=Nostocoides sp. F2B08 TaxID=2653936 RepID=UPI001263DF7E|nr:SDR family NAD(P)-dependent oxidoreductase [Tetrasphaera sp. F2B08]KAB7743475.1 SDR family NAD(P)-dependent oxidoreductase [Tetrasphaera sp. F2B08]